MNSRADLSTTTARVLGALPAQPTGPDSRGTIAFQPGRSEIEALLEDARRVIPGLATRETVLSVYSYNPDTILAVGPAVSGAVDLPRPGGFVATLPLSEAGRKALLDRTLNPSRPELRFICRQDETPSAIYVWCIYAALPLRGADVVSHLFERLSSAKYAHAILYSRPISDRSSSFFRRVGFRVSAKRADLLEYERPAAISPMSIRYRPASYDTFQEHHQVFSRGSRDIGIKVVHRIDELLKVWSIRGICYLHEQDCPYEEEFDGNDFSGNHLIGYVRSEPAGCLRIRYFGQFAKLERLAVAPRFRKSRLAFALISAGIDLCRKKGFTHLYGHSSPGVVGIWKRFGFVPRTEKPTFAFSEVEYLEGDLMLDLAPDVLTPETDPHVLIRPEGEWSRPGVLDRSARR